MSMETTLRDIDAWTKEMSVEMGRDELKEHIRAVEEAVAADMDMAGFRKGKIPLEKARENMDTAQVLQEALGRALEVSLSDAIALHHLEVMKVSDLKIKENSVEKLQYSITLHLFPEIKVPNLTACHVERRAIEVTEQDVSDALETLCNTRATFKDKATPVVQGNRVEVDFTVTMNGVVIEGGESRNHPLIVGGKNFIPGFEEALVGLSVGQEKDFSLEAPEDYYQRELAGKKLDFHVVVRKVQDVEKPELTDAFAQTVGHFATVEKLKNAVHEGLRAEKEHHERERVRGQMLEKLVDAAAITIPSALIDEQLEIMIADFDHTLHERGMELAMYLARLKKTQEDLKKDWRKDAERQVKNALLIRQIAKENHITTTDQEVEVLLNEALQSSIAQGQASVPATDVSRMRRTITERLINERVLEFIENICVT